jgi:hypothetical protein
MRAVLGVLLLGFALLPHLADARSPRARSMIRGMALGHYTDIRQAKLEQKLHELSELGVSHVSLVVSWSTPDVRSANIAPRQRYTTPDGVLLRMIRTVHRSGLKVFLFPIIDVQKRKPLEWRGTIKPASWDTWWNNYNRFILHYAKIAARTKTELFCVGSELVSTEKMRARWEDTIARVRRVYRGTLVYSANWDHYKPVVFWDLVDVMGLTAYYKLADSKTASEETMARAWRAIRGKLLAWSDKAKRPFIFTEVGYPSMDGGAVHPWDYTLSSPPDMEEQRRAISAFIKVWRNTPQLAGVVFWDWYGQGGTRDTQYTPRGKPAQEAIRAWYKDGGGQ